MQKIARRKTERQRSEQVEIDGIYGGFVCRKGRGGGIETAAWDQLAFSRIDLEANAAQRRIARSTAGCSVMERCVAQWIVM